MNPAQSEIYTYTASKIHELEKRSDTTGGKALLANLRRGIGKTPGELPELWGILLEQMPESFSEGSERKRSNAEKAIYHALTLYALSRQGNSETTNASGVSLGKAAAQLAGADENRREAVLRRLKQILACKSVDELAVKLRSFIQLLKGEGITLDFARLAQDMYRYAYPEGRESVRMAWARDFYKQQAQDYKNKGEQKDE